MMSNMEQRSEGVLLEEAAMSQHVVIKLGEESGNVYLIIDGDEYVFDPTTSRDVGEALYKTGCDAEVVAQRKEAS